MKVPFYILDAEGYLEATGTVEESAIDDGNYTVDLPQTLHKGSVPEGITERPKEDNTEELRIRGIKQKANYAILNVADQYKQVNLLARAIELVDKVMSNTITIDEQVELDSIKIIWMDIKAIREASNQAEVNGISAEDFNP